MSETVERSSLDLRYEGYRLRNGAAEARLLASIAERGIEEPLGGVDITTGSPAAGWLPPKSVCRQAGYPVRAVCLVG